jgi:hypothetical protein
MSAKNLKYSHAAYCIKRVQEVSDKPKAIPVPKKIIPTLKNTLPVKGVIQDEEPRQSRALTSNEVEPDDVEAVEFVKGQTVISDEIETDPMNKLKIQITKAQKEYKPNNTQPDLPMHKHIEIQAPEVITPPAYEVRMKNARAKQQEKYDKLTSNAF